MIAEAPHTKTSGVAKVALRGKFIFLSVCIRNKKIVIGHICIELERSKYKIVRNLKNYISKGQELGGRFSY